VTGRIARSEDGCGSVVLVQGAAGVTELGQRPGSSEVEHGGDPGTGAGVVDHLVCDPQCFARALQADRSDDPIEHIDNGACPLCGGDVRLATRSGIGLAGEAMNWSQHGFCLWCGTSLLRPIGPADYPAARMTPLRPWSRRAGDRDQADGL